LLLTKIYLLIEVNFTLMTWLSMKLDFVPDHQSWCYGPFESGLRQREAWFGEKEPLNKCVCSVTKYDDKLEIDMACDGSSNLGDGWRQRLISWPIAGHIGLVLWQEHSTLHSWAQIHPSIHPVTKKKMKKNEFIETSLIKRLLS